MARATATYNGGAASAVETRRLLHALEVVFVGVAILGASVIMLGADTIAAHWLKVEHLPISEVRQAILLMAAIVALRWIGGLYKGAIAGLERLVWLSGFNIAVATVRFVLVFPFFFYVGSTPTHYFGYQLCVAICELMGLAIQAYRSVPHVVDSKIRRFDFTPIRTSLKFSLSIAFTGAVWVTVTQTDKLLLSKILPLTDYAYFTLAVLVAGGVLVVSGPISEALLPRLTRLAAAKDESGLIDLYRNGTQMVTLIAVPAATVLALFSEHVLWAWTGNPDVIRKASSVLTLYVSGNAILAVAAFPYYLQYAKGDLKLHLIGNFLFVILLIPTMIWSASAYGADGAGYVWLASNAANLLLWIPLVHRRFIPRLHTEWLKRDIGPIVLGSLLCGGLVKAIVVWPSGRFQTAALIALVSIFVLLGAATSSRLVRVAVLRKWMISSETKVPSDNR